MNNKYVRPIINIESFDNENIVTGSAFNGTIADPQNTEGYSFFDISWNDILTP